jgi:preprotein translocase subunit SecE
MADRSDSNARVANRTEGGRAPANWNPIKFLQEVRQEVGKVTWPTRQETLISTIMVLVMVVLASLFFLASDQIIAAAVQFVLKIR